MIIHVLSSMVSDNHVVVTIDGYERWYFQTSDAYFHRAGGEVFVKKGQKVSITGTTDICRYCKTKGNGSLYYYVGETVQNANLIDAGRIGEQLANKADKSAVTTLQNRIYIKSSYINGTSWYRIWSDGWCEQGGVVPYASEKSVALLKNMVDTNYSILINSTFRGTQTYSPNVKDGTKTTSGFKIQCSTAYTNYIWEVKGYIS